MHIAIVHRDMHQVTRGGICTVYRNLGERLLALGHQVTYITQETTHPLQMPGAAVITLPRTDNLVAHRRAVTAALFDLHPDIAECSTWEAELLDYVHLPISRRVPVLVRADLSARTMGIQDLAADESAIIQAADRLIAVGSWTAADIAQAYGRIARVVPNGVDRSRFNPGPRNSFLSRGKLVRLNNSGDVIESEDLPSLCADTDALWERFTSGYREHSLLRIMWLGKMTTMKGFDRLQEIVLALRECAVFTIVIGHGQVHYPITINNESHVQFLQDLSDDDVPKIYRSADYKLTTSRWEGFGLADAEALACGLGLLMPEDLGTAKDLLVNGVTGAIWRDPRHLASLLASRIPLRGALSSQFDWDANAATTANIYQEMLATYTTNQR